MKNKVVAVTGASSGIGRAIALEFASKGSKLLIAARNEQKLEEVAELIKAKGAEVVTVRADVSVEADCKRFIEMGVSNYGHLDVLVNNAGISMRALFNDTDLKVIKEVMDVNFWGMVYCTKFALPHLLKTRGSVVGVSSIAGFIGLPARTAYSASKFAMHGFLESLRTENLANHLHVLIASPGFTSSSIRENARMADGSKQKKSPLEEGKIMRAEEVAELLYTAISKRKNRIILSRDGKLVVFLNKWMPNLIRRIVYNRLKQEPNSPLK